MLPVYTRYLTPADYGVLQLIDVVVEVASIVAGSRLGTGIFRFYHKAETCEERREVLSTAFMVILHVLLRSRDRQSGARRNGGCRAGPDCAPVRSSTSMVCCSRWECSSPYSSVTFCASSLRRPSYPL